MRFIGIIAVVCTTGLAVGCDGAGGNLGGQSGTAQPPGCVEDSRVEVGDLSVPAEGFGFSAQARLDDLEGTWRGSAELAGGGPADLVVTVAWDGEPVEAVLSHYEEGDPGDGDPDAPRPGGLPQLDCSPVYEIGFELTVDAAPQLEGIEGSTRVALAEAFGAELPIEVDAGDVGGTLSPPDWPNPQYWDRTSLAAIVGQHDGTTSLTLLWWAINDDAEPSSGTTTTEGGGQVGTGVVEPSGMTEPIAYVASLVRD